jgi:phage gpG-like protein
MYSLRLEGTERLRAALDPAKFQKAMVKALTNAGSKVQTHAVKQHLQRGNPLFVRTKQLMSSVATLVDAARLRVRVGTNLVYGPVMEYGATIRPKNPGGVLVFPVAVGYGRGARLTTPMKQAGKWHYRVGPKGQKHTISGAIEWVFAKKVVIPPRPWLGPALRDERDAIVEQFRQSIERSLRQ